MNGMKKSMVNIQANESQILQSRNGKIEQVHREYKSVNNDTLIFNMKGKLQ